MSAPKQIALIKFHIKDINLSLDKENIDFEGKNIGCYVKINEKVFDILLFNKKEPPFCNLIIKRNDIIEVFFKNVKKNGSDYGHITVDLNKIGLDKDEDNKKLNFSEWFVLNENIHSFSENNKNSSKVLIYMEIEWINSLQEIKNDNNGNLTKNHTISNNIYSNILTANNFNTFNNSNKINIKDPTTDFFLLRMKTLEENLIKFKESLKNNDGNPSIMQNELKTMKSDFQNIIKQTNLEKNPEIIQSFNDTKLHISQMFIELEKPLKKAHKTHKESYNFDKFLDKMEKEISILSKITDNCSSKRQKIAKYYENLISDSKKTAESLQSEIEFLKELNDKLENKVCSLTKQSEKTEKPVKSFENNEDLKILLNIVSFIGNNPGVMTIILHELRDKLKLDVSKQIYEQIEKINKKLAGKNEDIPLKMIKTPPVSVSARTSLKKVSISDKKPKIYESPYKYEKKDDYLRNSLEIDKRLMDYKDIEIKKLDEDGYYKIGNRKVVLQMVNGKLVVRIGGGFLQIKDFLEFHNIQEIRRGKGSSAKKNEKFFNEKSI